MFPSSESTTQTLLLVLCAKKEASAYLRRSHSFRMISDKSFEIGNSLIFPCVFTVDNINEERQRQRQIGN